MQEELKVALIQSPLIWESPEENRLKFSQKLERVLEDTDLIVLPEMFTTGFTMTPSKIEGSQAQITVEWMQQMAFEKNAAIMGSIVFPDGDQYLNKLVHVEPEGSYKHYDKRHTFTLAGEDKVFRAGDERLLLEYKGFKICPLICYDLRFPVWSRNTVNYDLLIYVANWPKPRINAWDTLLQARAIENMAYCIGVNRIGKDALGHEYPGHSAVYDCLGERQVFSQGEEILYATLRKEHINTTRNTLKFLQDRDRFTLER